MIILVLIVLGLCFGSFTNALVWRLHKQDSLKGKQAKAKYSISQGRSMCVHCGHILRAQDLIPVVSWALLRGKCRYCSRPIQDTPTPELITPLLFVTSYYFWPIAFDTQGIVVFIVWLILLVGFVALALYDIRWHLLPNRIIFPLMGLVSLQIVIQTLFFDFGLAGLIATFFSILAGGGIFWVLFQASDGKWIGGGDVKLGFLIGAILGSPLQSLLFIFTASLIGTIFAVPMLLSGKTKKSAHLAFGPFLLISAVIVHLFGAILITWYRSQIGL